MSGVEEVRLNSVDTVEERHGESERGCELGGRCVLYAVLPP